MQKDSNLIRENNELRARLALAEKWMAREVASSIKKIRQESLQRNQRKHLDNIFESDQIDIITRNILQRYGDTLKYAPKYTLEHLIDAEIYWYTLQKYPTMDALPVILAYQKILDAWIEEMLILQWRESMKKKKFFSTHDPLEKDLENIILKHYTLSIGRFYHIISLIRENTILPPLVQNLVEYWKSKNPRIFGVLISDDFFSLFSDFIRLEIFSSKRHEKKVKFSDARYVHMNIDSIFLNIFRE